MSARPSSLPWEVTVRWGNHLVTTEVVDASRPTLRLGRGADADVVTGTEGTVTLRWRDGGLEVDAPPDTVGAVLSAGQWPRALEPQAVLLGGDEAQLTLGTLAVEVRRSRAARVRLPFDARWLGPIGVALLLLAVMVASLVAPSDGPKLKWLKRPAPPQTTTASPGAGSTTPVDTPADDSPARKSPTAPR